MSATAEVIADMISYEIGGDCSSLIEEADA
jgi:hypothetical protein